MGRRVVVSDKYATEVRVDGLLRLVQWRGGWRPEYDAGCESATFEVASIGEDAVALRRSYTAPIEAVLTEAAGSTDVIAEAEASAASRAVDAAVRCALRANVCDDEGEC